MSDNLINMTSSSGYTGGTSASSSSADSLNIYNTITLSETTKQRRAQIKQLQDKFMTFAWGGCDAFEVFGAFIINEKKGSLKFYNGPGFSNEYTKPQFDPSGGELIGVTFNKQTISFTIGVYWISIEDYRIFLSWLNPNKVDYLYFGHEPKYRYNVKLSKIGDSTRWVVGSEVIDGKIEQMYYTELPLTFEVQGEPCAKGFSPYLFGEAEGFTWKDNYSYRPETKQSDILVQTTTEVKQMKMNGFTGQTFIFDGESDMPFWCKIPGRSRWNNFLGYSKSIQCQGNGELILQREPSNKNRIYCANSAMELSQWAIESGAIKLNDTTITNVDNVDFTTPNNVVKIDSEQKTNNKEFYHKPFYITQDVYIYTFDTVEVNGCYQPRWFVREVNKEGDDPAGAVLGSSYFGRDPYPGNKTTCIKITATPGKPKNIYFQLPAKMFNKNGYLKDPSKFVAWSINSDGTNHERFHGWQLNFEMNGNTIVPYYYNCENTRDSAMEGTTSFCCDYPVKKNTWYKVSGKTDWPLPHYMILNSSKELLYGPDESTPTETKEIFIEEDGYIRLQCFKNHGYGYGEKQVKLELLPNPVWKTITNSNPEKKEFEAILNTGYDFIPSDLDTPFEVILPFNLCQNDDAQDATYEIDLRLTWGSQSIKLFNTVLYNLTHYIGYSNKLTKTDLILLGVEENSIFEGLTSTSWGNNQKVEDFMNTLDTPSQKTILKQNIQKELVRIAPKLTLTYNSFNGVLYLKTGGNNNKILNLLTLNDKGERIIKNSTVYKTKIPGRFSIPSFYNSDVKLKLTITKQSNKTSNVVLADEFVYNFLHEKPEVICFPRTNIA